MNVGNLATLGNVILPEANNIERPRDPAFMNSVGKKNSSKKRTPRFTGKTTKTSLTDVNSVHIIDA